MRYPEGLVVVGPLPFGSGDHALVEGSAVMGERWCEVGRAQEHVDVVEVAAPGRTRNHAPVLMMDELRQRREVVTGLLKGEKQPHVEPERFVFLDGVHALWPAFSNRRTGSCESVRGV